MMKFEVIWQAKRFGFYQRHVSWITIFDAPSHLRDEMPEGRFSKFVHDHFFELTATGTRMRDMGVFPRPFGFVGRIIEAAVLEKYLQRLIVMRSEAIREKSEASQ